MADDKESSVLFSLKELMSLEEQRIAEEEAQKAAKLEAERGITLLPVDSPGPRPSTGQSSRP